MEWVFIAEWFHIENYLTIPFERNDPATAKQRPSKVYRYKNMTAICYHRLFNTLLCYNNLRISLNNFYYDFFWKTGWSKGRGGYPERKTIGKKGAWLMKKKTRGQENNMARFKHVFPLIKFKQYFFLISCWFSWYLFQSHFPCPFD